ncbi:hypothetical protein [Novosphingobium sp.]|uniref:hypothetical protein n=1 Tax=Novosphingobium sp. TaxID=1874826 RepID=UPI002FE27060
MEWLVTASVTVILIVALPPAIMAAKKSVRGNGRMAGVALTIGLAFSFLQDPRRREVAEHVAKRKSRDADRDEERLR